jgi:hypothetical protein
VLAVGYEGRWLHYTDGTCELRLPLQPTLDCARPGQDSEQAVRYLMSLPEVADQLMSISNADMRRTCDSTGAWSEEELLADEDMTRVRFVWLAACEVAEEYKMSRSFEQSLEDECGWL